MKVLQIAPYMTCNELPLLSQCKAGFGYMVYDIAKSLAHKVEVEVLLNNYRYEEFERDGIRFRATSFGLFLKNICKCCSPILVFRLWRKFHMQLRTFVRMIYAWLISGYYYDIINKGNYDIIHIHGCGFYNELWMDICRRQNQKFVITLHGLNSFSDSVKLELAGKRYERLFLQKVIDGEMPITVISSGIKKTIEQEFGRSKYENIHIVCNSFSFDPMSENTVNIRNKYGIPIDAKILLYVGNISRNKNQEQLIDSFGLMPKDSCDNTYILFCGRNIDLDYSLDEILAKHPNSSHLILCGNVNKKDMPSYYKQADGVVLLSIAEGFGLSLIEGMHFGKPCITFCDLDAFDDIYDNCAVIGIKDRNNQSVADGMVELLQGEWNEEAIKNYSKKFESKHMADNYISVYKQVIGY